MANDPKLFPPNPSAHPAKAESTPGMKQAPDPKQKTPWTPRNATAFPLAKAKLEEKSND